MDDDLKPKPDPVARQSDLTILRSEQRVEHIKTRALFVITAAAANAKALSYVLGSMGYPIPWRSLWPW